VLAGPEGRAEPGPRSPLGRHAPIGRRRIPRRVAGRAPRILRRASLNTAALRLAVLERHVAATQGLLTERMRRQLVAAKGGPRHVEARVPGELVCLDTFYVGKLKGVGKVWQYTACDAASSYALARLAPELDSATAAAFLAEIVAAFYAHQGCPLQRVLTDGGTEYKGAFTRARRQLGIRHTRIKPRYAWTNGFVERLQGTILQEHWRVAFRCHYFTSLRQLQRSLDRFLDFYNWHRTHRGYRTRGRTPGQTLLANKEAA
jgi:transposase InsO family protein